jgi:formylglycine-generating enzyme required for sulfatase activity
MMLATWLRQAGLAGLLVALVSVGAAQTDVPAGKKLALVVGVRDYDSTKFDSLQFTENDAEELAKVLAKQSSFTVRVLTTTRGKKREADAPTLKNLQAEIKALLARKTKHDTLLVFLAGHGIQATVKEGDKEKDESFFCPSDAQLNDNDTLLNLGKLFRDLDGSGAGVKLLLVDACRNDPTARRSVDPDAVPRPPRGLAALFACKAGERSFETDKLGGVGHGVFTHFLLEGLRGQAKNKRGAITWGSLVEYVTDKVSDEVPMLIGGGARQTPHLLTNLEGKSPLLVAAGPSAGKEKKEPSKEPLVKKAREITNSIGMRLVLVPAGSFTMGSPKAEREETLGQIEDKKEIRDMVNAEGPQHGVEITRAFFMGVHEVTQAELEKVMGGNPSFFSALGKGGDKVKGMRTDDFPVESVSWHDAVKFCERLSALPAEKAAGRVYRLPTEAEWEYACRGGTQTTFHFGNTASSRQANFDGEGPYGGSAKGPNLERTTRAGAYKANAFGLFDMHGNVWEWCSDWYDAGYYRKSSIQDPTGAKEGKERVLRGGSFVDDAWSCRATLRNKQAPDERTNNVGFRVVCEAAGER